MLGLLRLEVEELGRGRQEVEELENRREGRRWRNWEGEEGRGGEIVERKDVGGKQPRDAQDKITKNIKSQTILLEALPFPDHIYKLYCR